MSLANACDSHIHINDAAAVDAYRAVQGQQGTSRVVIVTPRPHVTDNTITMGAIASLGIANARGVAVIRPDVTDAGLRTMDAAGIRGIRFSTHQPVGQVVSIDMIEPLSKRIAPLGWHVQIHMNADQVVENAALLGRLPSAIVFDHMGRIPHSDADKHRAFGIIRGLVDRGRTWVKVSGPYLDDPEGGPRFAAAVPLARAWVAAAPDRCVWGSDWPHPLARVPKPKDRELIDLLDEWAPDAAIRTKILVDNPAELYFP